MFLIYMFIAGVLIISLGLVVDRKYGEKMWGSRVYIGCLLFAAALIVPWPTTVLSSLFDFFFWNSIEWVNQ